jgi:predicted RecB family endonuclease
MGSGNDDLKRLADDMQRMHDKLDEHRTEVKAWRQEDLTQTSSLASTVETLTTKLQDLAARVVKLEGTTPTPDPDVVASSVSPHGPMSPPNPSVPPNPAVPPLNPSGGGPPDGA